MNDKYKPLVWMGATLAGAVLLDREVVRNFLEYVPAFNALPLTIKQTGLELAVNSAMSYFTLRSVAKNWVPDIGRYLKRSKMVAAAGGLAFGLTLTFPQDAGYLGRKLTKLQFFDGVRTLYTRATCSEKGSYADQRGIGVGCNGLSFTLNQSETCWACAKVRASNNTFFASTAHCCRVASGAPPLNFSSNWICPPVPTTAAVTVPALPV